ncbi:DUF4254 domain-containing protein [Nocardia terpenica]|uniref:DUF4254 domain-containing protein n=1 Tax=Nocardia terpenica TaxID=455432 RepID=A0A6G9YZS7_9NOCA|nr:DUF4254 domain-containing protein [Nocardia terpenica]QIS18748.1 DUF4254 domain-containing protein [Nocardia terpenica]
MKPALPSREMILAACTGNVDIPHPVLEAACALAELHEARLMAEPGGRGEIDRARAHSVRDIDRWVAANMPVPLGAAYLHTESMGMVVDRLAQFSVTAYAALANAASQEELHFAWQRLAELSLAYADLAFEISTRRRRLPDLGSPDPHDPRI